MNLKLIVFSGPSLMHMYLKNIRKNMVPKGNMGGMCSDCKFTFKYFVKPRCADAEILKKSRYTKCGNFALKLRREIKKQNAITSLKF